MRRAACCVCGESLHTDTQYVELEAEWKPPDRRPQMYYAHLECIGDLNEPEDFGGGGSDGADGTGGGPPMYDP